MRFYNVSTRRYEDVPDSRCVKHRIPRKGSARTGFARYMYNCTAVSQTGARLVRFLSYRDYRALRCPERP